MRRTWSSLTVVLLAVAVVSLSLGGCAGQKPTKGDVYVYVAAPLSGWQADGGQTVVGGARLAAEQLNEHGGLLGYRVVVVALDDEADSDVAVDVATQVADAVSSGQKVLGVIGHYNSGQTAAALETYKDLPIVVVTSTASDVSLTEQGYRNFFRVNATDAAQGPFDADFLVNDLGAQRIVLIYAENDYGQGLRNEMVPALEALGVPPVATIGIEEGADTQAQIIPEVQAANPDAIFLAGYETEGYIVLPELREAGIMATFVASDGCFLYDFVDGSGQWSEGAYVSGITPDSRLNADDAWWQAYKSLEARNPGTYSLAGYSAMTVIAEGAREAGSLDSTAISQALRQASVNTLVGAIRYDDKGDVTEPRIYMYQVRDGEFHQVKPAAE